MSSLLSETTALCLYKLIKLESESKGSHQKKNFANPCTLANLYKPLQTFAHSCTLAPLQTLQPCKPLANVKSLNETTALCLYKLIKLESENKVFMQKPKNTMSI